MTTPPAPSPAHATLASGLPVVKLVRGPSTDQGTFGRLVWPGGWCHTVELPWRDNRPQRSCIPPGTYRCAIVNSPKFGRVYGVANVPGRSHILIHAANLGGDVDKGWATHLQGCIAPADKLGAIAVPAPPEPGSFTTPPPTPGTIPGTRMQRAGLISRPALRRFMQWAGGKPFILEITSS